MPAYAHYRLDAFAFASPDEVLGRLSAGYASERFAEQRTAAIEAWREQIAHLQTTVRDLLAREPKARRWYLLIEYPMPRRGRRIDAVLIAADIIFVLEYKTGASPLTAADRRQVEDYALDLRDFHSESRGRTIIPVLVTPNCHAPTEHPDPLPDERVQAVHVTGAGPTDDLFATVFPSYHDPRADPIDAGAWDTSPYRPVPTIVEAARALYADHSVHNITRSEAGAENLSRTSTAVLRVIRESEENRRKAICFVTGVPGAGKTLAGLNVVHGRDLHPDKETLGVYLSGNGPLVKVLAEALALDRAERTGEKRVDARRKVRTFIQNVHDFLGEHGSRPDPPPDRVVVFDEAQRAWNAEYAARSRFARDAAEPVQMLRVMDRHPDWAVVVALVGNGQEINRGEAGLPEWGRAIAERFPNWHAHVSPALAVGGGTRYEPLFAVPPQGVTVRTDAALHLSVSLRSYRAESLSAWVDAVLAGDALAARAARERIPQYPIALVRDLEAARGWLRARERGERRAGLVASSGARRLRPYGLDVTADLDEPAWFLNDGDDVRSAPFLELAATEFAVQGLELDWAGVCWDADLRRAGGVWTHWAFKGKDWQRVKGSDLRTYLENEYRVLLTRAREGIVVWVPAGSESDPTRAPDLYDGTAEYLRACGAEAIDR